MVRQIMGLPESTESVEFTFDEITIDGRDKLDIIIVCIILLDIRLKVTKHQILLTGIGLLHVIPNTGIVAV
jgi:hypothetical protein